MPRKPKPDIKRRVKEEDWRIKYLLHGKLPAARRKGFEAFLWTGPREHSSRRELWEEVKDKLLSAWIRKRPCTRPWAWFEFDAPRQDDKKTNWFYHGSLPEERLKVGGGGEKSTLSYVPKYKFGVFKYWDFDGNEPLFESQAVYLQRLGLLSQTEERYLNNHPELLEPESFLEIFGGKDGK